MDTATVMVMAARQRHNIGEGASGSAPPRLTKIPGNFVWVAFQTALSVVGLMPQVAWSQAEAAGAPNITIVPRVSISETYTNNVLLQSAGKQNELITQISPGISISSRAGRIKGTFDYSLNELFYAKNTSARQSQNSP